MPSISFSRQEMWLISKKMKEVDSRLDHLISNEESQMAEKIRMKIDRASSSS